MTQFMITYLGMGNPPASKEEGMAHMAKYKAWLDSLGEAVVSPANPLKNTHVVAPDGSASEGGKTGMSGFTLVQAESYEQALEMAKSCPFLEVGGSLEVSEMIEMPM